MNLKIQNILTYLNHKANILILNTVLCFLASILTISVDSYPHKSRKDKMTVFLNQMNDTEKKSEAFKIVIHPREVFSLEMFIF